MSRETTGGMVDVGMELEIHRWCILVVKGADYKMTYCWLVSFVLLTLELSVVESSRLLPVRRDP